MVRTLGTSIRQRAIRFVGRAVLTKNGLRGQNTGIVPHFIGRIVGTLTLAVALGNAVAAGEQVILFYSPIIVPQVRYATDPAREARKARFEWLRQEAGREGAFKPPANNPWWSPEQAESAARLRPQPSPPGALQPEYREASQVRPEFATSGQPLRSEPR